MSVHWILPLAVQDVIRFTVAPTGNRVVTLSDFTAPMNCFVDWGDGVKSAQITSNAPMSHTYADATRRQICIRGVLGGFWNSTSVPSGKNMVVSLDEITSQSLLSMTHTFRSCTSLLTLPSAFDAPNVTNFSYTFYNCQSITSVLPALWLTHKNATHTGCFTNCFKSLYGQHGTGCSNRQYVSAVQGQTYYQKYGTSGCPASTYHSTPNVYCVKPNVPVGTRVSCNTINNGSKYESHYFHGGSCYLKDKSSGLYEYQEGCSPGSHLKSYGSSYYGCSYFGGTCKGSSCTRTYTSGQSAYYRCARSGSTCPTTSCPYPYANEASYNNARSAGWA